MTYDLTTELQKMWSIFLVDPNSPISLRALSPSGTPSTKTPKIINITDRNCPRPCVNDRLPVVLEALVWVANSGGHGIGAQSNPDVRRATRR